MDTSTDGIEIIEREYQKFYNNLMLDRKKPLRSTQKGLWGHFSCMTYYQLFKEIGLGSYKKFLDLGSGDGKVVLIASLFTDSSGIEYDRELYDKSLEIRKKTGIGCSLIKGDYMEHDLSGYDIVLINPDKSFRFIEQKIIEQLDGTLIVCNNVFLPRFMDQHKVHWVKQTPFYEYKNNTKILNSNKSEK